MLFAAVVGLAVISDVDAVTVALGVVAVSLVLRLIYDCAAATAAVRQALATPLRPDSQPFTREQAPALYLPEQPEQLEPLALRSVSTEHVPG